MDKALKMKIAMFSIIMIFMFVYMFVFGNKNVVIGVTVAMAGLMNLSNDLSYKPKLSFIKVLTLLLVLGVVSFLNNPITLFGCILTFLVVFGVTFTSYHLFAMSIYLPYLMCYFMMMCIPVSIEDLPMRLIGLFFGAVFIVGINLLANRKKEYKLSKATITNLIDEINNAIDIKLAGGEVSKENFKVANDFYKSIFSKFEYKYFSNSTLESVLNLIKAFQYIGWILSDYELSADELKYIKNVLKDIENVSSEDIFNGITVKRDIMNLILLNLEIIAYEVENKDLTKDNIIPDKKTIKQLTKPIIKRQFSFRSVKFTFAFKMALVLTLWEVLTLIFNLPYTKWLYFASIPLMLPYVNDVAYTAKTRVIGTVVGVFIFSLIIIALPFLSISSNLAMMLVLIICMFGMVYKMEDKLQMAIYTTVMSVMVSLMYITPPEAIVLKILWVVVAVIVVSLINFGFLPYSVERETKNNLIASLTLNEESIKLIKSKATGRDISKKLSLLVVSNIIRENIEVTEDNRHLYEIQVRITDICNFIVNYMNIHEMSHTTKEEIVGIIDNDESFNDEGNVSDRIMLYSTQYVVKLFNEEKELIKKLN